MIMTLGKAVHNLYSTPQLTIIVLSAPCKVNLDRALKELMKGVT